MRLLKLTFSILSISLLIACGGEKPQEEASTAENQPTSSELLRQQKESATNDNANEAENDEPSYKTINGDVVELTIEGNDKMRYNLQKMKVKAGSTIKLTLKHVGEMSVQMMGHNWVLLKQGTDIMDFGQKAASASNNGYIPEAEANKVIAYTETIGGGKEATITFEAPEKGTYDFICSFPGHVSLMQGKFIVE